MARYNNDIILRYDLTEGSGVLLDDSSGVTSVIDQTIQNASLATWISGQGIHFDGTYSMKQGTGDLAAKLNTLEVNDVFTYETWIMPDNLTQGSDTALAVVAGHNNSTGYRNFLFGQSGNKYGLLLRGTDGQNSGVIFIGSTQNVANDTPQHIAVTVDCASTNTAKFYINSVLADTIDISSIGELYFRSDWHSSLGGEVWGANYFHGDIYFSAMHSSILTDQQISDNYDAGFIGYTPTNNTINTPTITQQPQDNTAVAGGTASFSVVASLDGNGSIDYVWRNGAGGDPLVDGSKYSGVNTSSISISNVESSDNNTSYYCSVYNSLDILETIDSTSASLTVDSSDTKVYGNDVAFTTLTGSSTITITSQPVDVEASLGEEVSFHCEFSGPTNKGYQWWENTSMVNNSVSVSGATTNTLTIFSAADHNNNDNYICECKDLDHYPDAGSFLYSNGGSLTITQSPSISISNPTNIGVDSVTLNGLVNSSGYLTNYYFVWGTSEDAMTNSSPVTSNGSNSTSNPVSHSIDNLDTETTYYYRLIANNTNGESQSDIGVFSTSDPSVEWTDEGLKTLSSDASISSSQPATSLISSLKLSNSISVEAWVQPTTTDHTDTYGVLFGLYQDNENLNFSLEQEGTKFRFRLRTSNTDSFGSPIDLSGYLTSPELSVSSTWQHIVATYNGSLIKLYLDGVESVSKALTGDFSTWGDFYATIGSTYTPISQSWLGEYQLLTTYERDLTAAEVLQNYNAGRSS